jgi:methylated-DNA-protein-cysteine methyltransferase-like protein
MPEQSAEDRILAAIRAIPRGQVAGYGHIAQRAGLPGRARLVARILAGNEDSKLPWHRVLRSDGRIAFRKARVGGASSRSDCVPKASGSKAAVCGCRKRTFRSMR